MNIDNALLLGRVIFVAALYLFVLMLALLLVRELRSQTTASDQRAPGDLLIVDPAETGLDAGERIPLLVLSRIGRSSENDIVLNDSFVSTEHARMTWNTRGWTVQDLESTNGTRINGKPVKRSMAVKPGDTIEFGRAKCKLVSL